MKKFLTGIMVVISFAALLALGVMEFNKVIPNFKSQTVELGDVSAVSKDIHAYLSGREKILERATLDISGVNCNKVGAYKIHCRVDGRSYDFKVDVVDTTAPALALKQVNCLKTGELYTCADLVEQAFDASGSVDMHFEIGGNAFRDLSFATCGEREITVVAVDPSANTTRETLNVKFDDAPYFMFLNDKTAKVGSSFNLLDYVQAMDNENGLITDRIVIDTGDFNINEKGDYDVTYSVCDDNGLYTSKTITVSVGDKTVYNNTISKEEIALLDSCGHFSYSPLTEDSKEGTIELTKWSSVGLTSTKGFGSAFIYDITPDYVYCLTANHCMKAFKKNMSCMFFDDTTTRTYEPVNYIACKAADLAMFCIPTSEIGTETLLNLKEAYIDKDIYSKINTKTTGMVCTPNWRGGEKAIYSDAYVKAVDAASYLDRNDFPNRFLITNKNASRPGQSGSGVFDNKGNLIGIVQGAYYSQELQGYFGVQVSIEYIDELVERMGELTQ